MLPFNYLFIKEKCVFFEFTLKEPPVIEQPKEITI